MLLNEPTPHQARPAAATAAAAASTRELPPIEVDGAPTPARTNGAQADTVAFTAVDAGSTNGSGANGSGGASPDSEVSAAAEDGESPGISSTSGISGTSGTSSAGTPTVGIVTVGGSPDVHATVALDVDAVKRALAEGRAAADATDAMDATDTVSLDVEGVKQALAEEAGATAGGDALAETTQLDADSIADTEHVAEDAQDGEASTDLVPAAEPSTDPVPAPSTEHDDPSGAYLASTNLSTSASTLVAVPETADDVIATIHAAATVVAEADRRARRAAVAKADPWTGLDLHQPAAPEPVDDVLDLLSPVLERPLLVVEQPGPPAAADVVALHRSELEVDFVEPPVVAAGAEPAIPPRYGPGLSVLPHIEFPG